MFDNGHEVVISFVFRADLLVIFHASSQHPVQRSDLDLVIGRYNPEFQWLISLDSASKLVNSQRGF